MGETFYHVGNDDVDDLAEWAMDAGGQVPATRLPTTGDIANLMGNVYSGTVTATTINLPYQQAIMDCTLNGEIWGTDAYIRNVTINGNSSWTFTQVGNQSVVTGHGNTFNGNVSLSGVFVGDVSQQIDAGNDGPNAGHFWDSTIYINGNLSAYQVIVPTSVIMSVVSSGKKFSYDGGATWLQVVWVQP